MILFVLGCIACFASFPSKSQRNQTLGYFHNWVYLPGIRLGVSNIQYLLYICIYIGIFIMFVILSYFYENAHIQCCRITRFFTFLKFHRHIIMWVFVILHSFHQSGQICRQNVLGQYSSPWLFARKNRKVFRRKWATYVTHIGSTKYTHLPTKVTKLNHRRFL